MQYNVTRATTTLFSYTVYNSVQFYYYFTFITCSLTVLPHAAVFFPSVFCLYITILYVGWLPETGM